MDAVNAAMSRFFDALWAPFGALPLWVGVLVLGIAFGVLALLAMKYTTNQKRVERYKDRYQGHILAIKLFRDSFGVVIASLVKTLAWVGAYLTEQFKPMFVMLVPFVLLFGQLMMRAGFTPLPLGEKTLLTVEMAADRSPLDVKVELPSGVEAAGPAIREPSRHRLIVPIVARAAGVHALKFDCGGPVVEKTLHAGPMDGTPMVSPVRSQDFWDRVLYPGEPAFGAGSPIEKIELHYPVRPLSVLGLDLSFGSEIGLMLTFVVVTIVAAFALKGVFGVTI